MEEGARDLLAPYLKSAAHVVKAHKAMLVGYCPPNWDLGMGLERELFGGLWGGVANRDALQRSTKGQ